MNRVRWPVVALVAVFFLLLLGLAYLKVPVEFLVGLGAFGTAIAAAGDKFLHPSTPTPPALPLPPPAPRTTIRPPATPPPPGVVGIIAFVLGTTFAVGADMSCKSVDAPSAGVAEAGVAVGSDVCSLLEGIDDSGVLRTICATAIEIATIAVPFILTLRATDAGGPPDSVCQVLPGTTLCATSRERAKAVLVIVRARAALLTVDGGH